MKILENPEAEQSVLGALLVRPELVGEVAAMLSPQDFYREAHSLIYQTILDLHSQGEAVDLVTVTHKLKESGQLTKVGGPVFLAGLSEQIGFAVNAPSYSKIVKETAYKRKLKTRLQGIISEIDRPDSKIGDLLDFADSQVIELWEKFGRNGKPDRIEVFAANDLLSQDLQIPQEIIGHGILPQGAGMFLTGDSGLGKSLLTLEMAVRLSQGLGLWGLPVSKAHNVLIVQAENPDYSMNFRLRRILAGLNLSHAPKLFLTPSNLRLNLSTPKDYRNVANLISGVKAEIIILDPLIAYHSTPENDNSQMRGFLDSLTDISRNTGVAWILVHHHGRPQDGESRYRGASAIKDWADTFLTLSAKASQERTLLELTFVKIRHGAGRPPLILERDSNFIHFLSEEDGIAPPSSVVKALGRLGGQCAGITPLVNAIREVTGCSERTAYSAISKAASDQKILIQDHGRKKIYLLQRPFAVVDPANGDCS